MFGGRPANPVMSSVAVSASVPAPVGGHPGPAANPANTATPDEKRAATVKALDVGYEIKHTGGPNDGKTHAAPNHMAMHGMLADHFGHRMGP